MLNYLGSTGGWIALGIVGFILLSALLIGIYVWACYNSLVKLRNNVEEGFSTMDVYMKKRYDLIPNLVETVKGYAKHEKQTLTEVISARNLAMTATDPNQKAKAEGALNECLKSLFALTENYPELKANANFLDLQNQLKSVEMDIANARKYYNAVVKEYNNKIQVFPSNIIAKHFNFTRRDMFEIDEEERKNVKVEF